MADMEKSVPNNAMADIRAFLQTGNTNVPHACQQRQKGKYEKLLQKHNQLNNSQTSKPAEINERSVINLSNSDLTDVERSVLRKGLNFSVSPPCIPKRDFIVAVANVAKILGPDKPDTADMRSQAAHII